MHILAFVICIVGLVILTAMGEPGALRQLVALLVCAALAVVLGAGMICLLFG